MPGGHEGNPSPPLIRVLGNLQPVNRDLFAEINIYCEILRIAVLDLWEASTLHLAQNKQCLHPESGSCPCARHAGQALSKPLQRRELYTISLKTERNK